MWYSTHDLLQDLSQSSRTFFKTFHRGPTKQNLSQKYSAQKNYDWAPCWTRTLFFGVNNMCFGS